MKIGRLLFRTLFFLLVFIVLVFLTGDFYIKEKYRNNTYPKQATQGLIIAHRGASGNAPENTLASVRLALEQKADMIEIDVFLSKDDQIVVMHDQKVDRTTNGQGYIENLTLKEVKQLDAGSWFAKTFKGEKIPTLPEVLHVVEGKAKLLIEIKKSGREIAQKVATLIHQQKASSWCVIQSFDPLVIENLNAMKSTIEKHQLVIGNLPLLLPYHYNKRLSSGNIYQYRTVQSINPMYLFTTKKVVDKIHQQKQKVVVWTVNQSQDMERLLKMGVDGLITNYPAKARKIRQQLIRPE